MTATRRGVRAVTVGLLLGLAVSFVVVARANSVNGEPMPLVTALQAAALAADLHVVVAGVPAADVYLPVTSGDWRAVLFALAVTHGLTVCELAPDTVLVSDSEAASGFCEGPALNTDSAVVPEAVESVRTSEVAAEPAEAASQAEVIAPAGLVYRVRVLQLDETRAIDLGLDWSGGVFETAAKLMAGGYAAIQGLFPVAQMGDLVRFLESEGVAMRLEDVELRSESGVPVSFNRGGTIAVNLVGGGGATIVERFSYGLGLDLDGTEEGGVVALRYRFSDSAPSNVSDPSNVQLASTTSNSLVRVPCGHSVVVAAIGSSREGSQGSGLPGLAGIPGAGYAFGVGGVVQGRSTFVVTVDVGCVL